MKLSIVSNGQSYSGHRLLFVDGDPEVVKTLVERIASLETFSPPKLIGVATFDFFAGEKMSMEDFIDYFSSVFWSAAFDESLTISDLPETVQAMIRQHLLSQ